ncbi:MAG TPA: hypothetical protein VFY18_07955 [Candidatus Limnocylindrales bacterium]|nr:hypothetical protein [Candidatus Limnocylindrales bacterium]
MTTRIARLLSLVVLVCGLVACSSAPRPIGSSESALSSPGTQRTAEPTTAPTASLVAGSGAIPVELLVTCDGTRIDMPVPFVRTQPDGIHVRFANGSGQPVDFGMDLASGLAMLGDSVPAAGGTFTFTFGPGAYRLRCADTSGTFAVVDPDRLYRPTVPDCASGSGTAGITDYAEGATGPRGSVLDVARLELRGLDPGDIVERAGYPAAIDDVLVRVVRGGRVVAVIKYLDDGHGGWLVGETRTCAGSDVTVVEPG